MQTHAKLVTQKSINIQKYQTKIINKITNKKQQAYEKAMKDLNSLVSKSVLIDIVEEENDIVEMKVNESIDDQDSDVITMKIEKKASQGNDLEMIDTSTSSGANVSPDNSEKTTIKDSKLK